MTIDMGHGGHRHHGGGGHGAHHHHGGGGGPDHLSLFFYLCYCLCSICEMLASNAQQPSHHHQESSCKSSVYVIDTTNVYGTDEVCLSGRSSDIGSEGSEDGDVKSMLSILIVFFTFLILLAIIIWSIDHDCHDDDCY